MIRVALVDDEENNIDELKRYVKHYQLEHGGVFETSSFSDGLDFITALEKGNLYDVVFMDIKMPYMNGLTAAKKLREKDKGAALIFITVMSQYAVKGYEYNALDYLVKPIDYLGFSMKLTKALEQSRKNNRFISLPDGNGGIVRLKSSSIYYIESENHYCVFHTDIGDFRKFSSMNFVENELRDEGFLRCNVSYIVNPAWVNRITQDHVVCHGAKLPISKRKRKKFIQEITKLM